MSFEALLGATILRILSADGTCTVMNLCLFPALLFLRLSWALKRSEALVALLEHSKWTGLANFKDQARAKLRAKHIRLVYSWSPADLRLVS
jgi:hypothetical protein